MQDEFLSDRINEIRAQLVDNPVDPSLLLQLAQAYKDNEESMLAIDAYWLVIRSIRFPSDKDVQLAAYGELADIYIHRKEYSAAEKAATAAFALAPCNAQYQLQLARIARGLEQYQKSVAYFQKFFDLKKTDFSFSLKEVFTEYIETCLQTGDGDLIREAVNNIMPVSTGMISVYLLLGKACQVISDPARAEIAYVAAIDLLLRDGEVLSREALICIRGELVTIYLQTGSYLQAFSEIQHALQAHPDDPARLYEALRLLLEKTKNSEVWKELYRKARQYITTLDDVRLSNAIFFDDEVFFETHCTAHPSSLHLILTNECNLQCIMCSRIREPRKTLPYKECEKIFPLLPYIRSIDWEGGEVFLVDYFLKLMDRITTSYPAVEHYITTSGLLINKEMDNILSRKNIHLQFSIDSVVPEIYEAIRCGASFNILTGILQRLSRIMDTTRYSVRAVIMRKNFRELSLFPDFCRKYGIQKLQLRFLYGFPEESIFFGTNSSDMVQEFKVQLALTEEKCEHFGIVLENNFNTILREQGNSGASGVISGVPSSPRCVKPWKSLALFFDGTVKPGCECGIPVGNMASANLEDVWNNDVMQNYRSKIRNNDAVGFCSEDCCKGIIWKAQLQKSENQSFSK